MSRSRFQPPIGLGLVAELQHDVAEPVFELVQEVVVEVVPPVDGHAAPVVAPPVLLAATPAAREVGEPMVVHDPQEPLRRTLFPEWMYRVRDRLGKLLHTAC